MELDGRIWLKDKGKNFLGRGKVELLERIAECGSISKAAMQMRMSYKAAWDSIDLMNKVASSPLVVRVTGGKGGGGTEITDKGREMIRIFRELERLEREFYHAFSLDLSALEMAQKMRKKGRIAMIKTSARNQLAGEVVALKEGTVSAEITLKCGSLEVVSAITLESLKNLGLRVGTQAIALIKASSIIIFSERPNGASVRNLISGKIAQIKRGVVNAEVTLDADGTQLAALITLESLEALGLQNDIKAWFGFKAGSVILGV